MRPRTIAVYAVLAVGAAPALAQQPQPPETQQDPSLNNLVHPEGYETAPLGSLGNVTVVGAAPQALLLIPGWGLSADIFQPLIDGASDRYTFILLAPAGFAATPAPPMPAEEVSYADRTWWSAFEQAAWSEIESRNLTSVVTVGFLDGAQSAAMLALQHPDDVAAVISISGEAYREFGQAVSADRRKQAIDTQMSQQWFRTVTPETWKNGMGLPAWYAEGPVGENLYTESLQTPIPTMVRYLCEHWATDMTDELAAIKTPMLAIMPDLTAGADILGYERFVGMTLVTPWKQLAETRDNVDAVTIEGARLGMMQTHTELVLDAINAFIEKHGLAD
jgi:pimeloyl-ACP methyl ester carboxylesterase